MAPKPTKHTDETLLSICTFARNQLQRILSDALVIGLVRDVIVAPVVIHTARLASNTEVWWGMRV